MPNGNGDHQSRFERLEKLAADLLEHARLADKRLDAHDRELEVLRNGLETMRTVTLETNERIAALVSAIGDYIRAREGDQP
jgi:phage shock protein A